MTRKPFGLTAVQLRNLRVLLAIHSLSKAHTMQSIEISLHDIQRVCNQHATRPEFVPTGNKDLLTNNDVVAAVKGLKKSKHLHGITPSMRNLTKRGESLCDKLTMPVATITGV